MKLDFVIEILLTEDRQKTHHGPELFGPMTTTIPTTSSATRSSRRKRRQAGVPGLRLRDPDGPGRRQAEDAIDKRHGILLDTKTAPLRGDYFKDATGHGWIGTAGVKEVSEDLLKKLS